MVETEKEFEVFPENWEAVTIFTRLSSQWNFSDGAFIGLNYQSVEFLFKLLKVRDRADVFDRIQTLEFSALKEINSRGK